MSVHPLRAAIEAAQEETGWPEPSPLPEGLPPVQEFSLDLLPGRLAPWIGDIAERMQVPADYPAAGAIVSLGAIVGRQIGIRPKRHDDWLVVPNLYGAIIGRPGLLKTPALQEVIRPLIQLEIEAKEVHADAIKEHEAHEKISKAREKLNSVKIIKDLKAKRDPAGIIHDLLADNDTGEWPARRRYLVNDSSVEKLGAILAENPRGVLVFRDELIGLLRQMERDGHEQDRAFYLETWNGNGRFTYDRIGRGTIDIEAACVSVLGGTQPGPLAAYQEAMAHTGAGDDGLMQRFQVLIWPDVNAKWRNVDRYPDREARERTAEVYSRLDLIDAKAIGAKVEEGSIPALRFDAEAQREFDHWRGRLETRLRSGDLHPALEAHLAKYRSLLPSLALLCHLADGCVGSVGAVSWARAEAWGEYLETHARRVYDSVIRADLCGARTLGEHLRKGELGDAFQLRDVYRRGWSGLGSRPAAAAAVQVLLDLDWLRAEEIGRAGSGGRPTVRYLVNPRTRQSK